MWLDNFWGLKNDWMMVFGFLEHFTRVQHIFSIRNADIDTKAGLALTPPRMYP